MTSSNKQDELRGECSGSKASRQPNGSADPGTSDYTLKRATLRMDIEVSDMPPTKPKKLSKAAAFKREIADISRIAGEYLQSRSFWRARTRVAESELAFALDENDSLSKQARSLNDENDKLCAESTNLSIEIRAIKARVEHREKDLDGCYAQRLDLQAENEKLKSQVAELSAKKPFTFDANGARFELHRILTQGGTRAEVLARVKNLRDRFGGDPSGEPGWTP